MEDFHEEVLDRVRQGLKTLKEEGSLSSFYNDVMGFLHAVDWSERWLLCLALLHASLWSAVVFTRRSYEKQTAVFLLLLALVYAAQWLNSAGAANWKSFAGQNYFDERGVFISVMYSAPLLAAAFFILVNSLRMASGLLIEVKKLQFRDEIKRRNKHVKKE